jgi:hypothetical protein
MHSRQNISTILSDKHFNSLKAMLDNERDKVRFAACALRLKYTKQFKNIAKAKASKKGLYINVDKAKKCPQTAVSVIPLPIIDPTQTPAASPTQSLDWKRHPTSTAPTLMLHRHKVQSRRRPTSTPSVCPSSHVLSPLSSSLQMLPFPDVNSQASAALMVPSMPTISVSHFSAISIEDRVPMDVLSLTDDDDLYSSAVSSHFVEKLSKEVLPDAVCWIDVEPNSDSSSSSSRPSSTGPETPVSSPYNIFCALLI